MLQHTDAQQTPNCLARRAPDRRASDCRGVAAVADALPAAADPTSAPASAGQHLGSIPEHVRKGVSDVLFALTGQEAKALLQRDPAVAAAFSDVTAQVNIINELIREPEAACSDAGDHAAVFADQHKPHESQRAAHDETAAAGAPALIRRHSTLTIPMDVLQIVVSFLDSGDRFSLRLVDYAGAEAVGNVVAEPMTKQLWKDQYCPPDTVVHDDEMPFEPSDDEEATLPVKGPTLSLALHFSDSQRVPAAARDLIFASRCGLVYALTFMSCIRTLSVTVTGAARSKLEELMITFHAGIIHATVSTNSQLAVAELGPPPAEEQSRVADTANTVQHDDVKPPLPTRSD